MSLLASVLVATALGLANDGPNREYGNPLVGLPSLAKIHYSWPIPPEVLADSPAVLVDYVRITGSCSVGLPSAMEPSLLTSIDQCVEMCLQSKANPTTCIAINFSPWYHGFPGSDPTNTTGEAEVVSVYKTMLQAVSQHLRNTSKNVGVGAILLDSEKFSCSFNMNGSHSAICDAVARKNDLIFNASIDVFPDAEIVQYARGSVSYSDTYGWVGPPSCDTCDTYWGHYTTWDLGTSFGTSIYSVQELYKMRQTFQKTVAAAKNMKKPTGVVPWLALGCGYRVMSSLNCSAYSLDKAPCTTFDFQFDYGLEFSWQMGSEINDVARYGPNASVRLAPWDYAKSLAFYPSVFDTRSPPSPRLGNSTTIMVEHFAAYVKGAAGLPGLY
eukprot:m.4764 g.4764  ORF g.4764 m.4764 type:complete len:384 (-) comp3096_c0_seq2:129-1280(-)